ncbi:MAG: hypothetical protein K8T25_02245 [Planctomycetia bacterium]|nr:hypothetical protein [Planctomycetia bacterium]
MTADNPYQSPRGKNQVAVAAAKLPPEMRRGRKPLVMIPLGLLAGAVVGGIFGAVGGTVLGLAHELSMHSASKINVSLIAGLAKLGGIFGVSGGTILGGIGGLWTGLARGGMRRTVVMVLSIVGVQYGVTVGIIVPLVYAIIGAALAQMIFGGSGKSRPPSRDVSMYFIMWWAVATIIGATSGFLSALVLGRLLARLCWGKALRKTISGKQRR